MEERVEMATLVDLERRWDTVKGLGVWGGD